MLNHRWQKYHNSCNSMVAKFTFVFDSYCHALEPMCKHIKRILSVDDYKIVGNTFRIRNVLRNAMMSNGHTTTRQTDTRTVETTVSGLSAEGLQNVWKKISCIN